MEPAPKDYEEWRQEREKGNLKRCILLSFLCFADSEEGRGKMIKCGSTAENGAQIDRGKWIGRMEMLKKDDSPLLLMMSFSEWLMLMLMQVETWSQKNKRSSITYSLTLR